MLNNHNCLTVNRDKMSVWRNARKNRLLKLKFEIKKTVFMGKVMINMIYFYIALEEDPDPMYDNISLLI